MPPKNSKKAPQAKSSRKSAPGRGRGAAAQAPGRDSGPAMDPMMAMLMGGMRGGRGGPGGHVDPAQMLAMMNMMGDVDGDYDDDEDSDGFDDDLFDEDEEDYDADIAMSTFGDRMMGRGAGGGGGSRESKIRDAYCQAYKETVAVNKAKYEKWDSGLGKYKVQNTAVAAGGHIRQKKKNHGESDFDLSSAEMNWKLDCIISAEGRKSVPAHSHYVGTLVDHYDEKKAKTIGTIKCILVHTHAIMNGRVGSVSNVLDEHTQELFDVSKFRDRMSRDGGKAKKSGKWVNYVGDADEATQGSFLYIESIEVEKTFRGTGAGLYMLQQAHIAINNYMSLTLLMINPFFNDDDGELAPVEVPQDDTDPEFQPAITRKLKSIINYYNLIGFKLVGDPTGDGHLCLGHWNGRMSPDIEEVCPHFF